MKAGTARLIATALCVLCVSGLPLAAADGFASHHALIGGIGVGVAVVNCQDASATTDANVPVAIDVLANDQIVGGAPGDSLYVQSVTTPTSGTAVINADNTVTYSPNLDFSGSDSFQYTAADQTGLLKCTATVYVTVNAVTSTTSTSTSTTTTTTVTSTSSTVTTTTSTTVTSTSTTTTSSVVGGIMVFAHRIPASYWDSCFATSCANPMDPSCNPNCSGPGASMYFALYDSNGNFLQGIFADENGNTFTGLVQGVTYYVYPDDCTACHGSTHDVIFDHWGDGSTIRPLATSVGSSLDAWYSCTNGCSGV